MAKPLLRQEAILLRESGASIKEIASKLKVSTSSASIWCRDVQLTKAQLNILDRKHRNPYYGNRLKHINKIKAQTDRKVEQLKKEGVRKVGKISTRELFIAGIALYWAEGFKKDKQVGFASMDPAMIKFFLKWLMVCFGITNENLYVRVTVNMSHKHRIKDIQNYWSDVTGISAKNFGKPFFQKVKWKKLYSNPQDYYGVLRIKVRRSTDFLRKIHGFIEGLRLQA